MLGHLQSISSLSLNIGEYLTALCFSISSMKLKQYCFWHPFETLFINMFKGFQDLHAEKWSIATVTVKTARALQKCLLYSLYFLAMDVSHLLRITGVTGVDLGKAVRHLANFCDTFGSKTCWNSASVTCETDLISFSPSIIKAISLPGSSCFPRCTHVGLEHFFTPEMSLC